MDKLTFESRLIEATERVLDFTQQFSIKPLPAQCRYFIYPNSSYDGGYGPIGNDEERFPEDSKIGVIGPVEASEVVNFLWRNGRIPQWIDINVQSTDSGYTYIRLVCCGRFMGESRMKRASTPRYWATTGTGSTPAWPSKNSRKSKLGKTTLTVL